MVSLSRSIKKRKDLDGIGKGRRNFDEFFIIFDSKFPKKKVKVHYHQVAYSKNKEMLLVKDCYNYGINVPRKDG